MIVKTVKLTKTIGNKEETETFSSNGCWIDKFYCFFEDGRKYFIINANETEMVFGEQMNPGDFNGKNNWLIKFKRKGNNNTDI